MVYSKKKKKSHSYENSKSWQISRREEDDDSSVEPRTTRLQLKLINSASTSYKPHKDIETNEEQTIINPEPKKKRSLSSRRYSNKAVIIDDEDSASSTKGSLAKTSDATETLQLLCWSEELSPVQLEVQEKREKEYNELISRLESLVKQNGGEQIHKSDGLQAFQYNTTIATPAVNYPQQSNGMPPTSTPSSHQPQTNNVLMQNPNKNSTGTNQNSYKFVLDPRLGMVIGTMTPAGQMSTTGQITQGQVTATTQNVGHTSLLRTQQRKRGRSSFIQSSNSSPSISAPSTSTIRPAESTAVGGLSAGTINAKQPAAIVDLTGDDGKPAADSREVAFNKLQGKTFPSLVVVARPNLHAKEAAISNDRSILDSKVKSVLVHTPTKFTEWLIQQGLVRSEQNCTVHPSNKLNLGMYSDASKFPYSGGYVWISECCPHRFVSVFSGSLFEGAAHPPTVLLKLMYHWSCQTNIQNVVQWVKVDNLYVKGLFTWLRAVCTYALQKHLKPLGGLGRKIEVGVISLGTTSQDGSQRQVKVEVLGILDPEKKLIRLRAVEPLADGERNYKRRFSKILEPLKSWVHPDSIICTDLTVDKGTLHFMGFSNIIQNTQRGVPGNQGIMEYLRKIVPRMFQNTLSLLSRQIIQQFLDELVWREWYGKTADQSFTNLVIHVAEQTRMNVSESLISRLNKIAANPFKNHLLTYQTKQATFEQSQGIKRYGRKRLAPPISSVIDLENSSIKATKIMDNQSINSSDNVPLEAYYYGTLDGDPNSILAQKVKLNVRCCVCKVPYTNNIELLDHLLAHAHNISSKAAVSQCRYCLASLPTVQDLNAHVGDLHPTETRAVVSNVHPVCVICEQRFSSIYMLGKHMSREHVPQELPYQCGTCGFRTSCHRIAIDHFYNTHNGAATVQCPFCLKSTAVWSSGRIMSTNVTFFLAHLQKHQKKTMAKKCHKCALWFIQKDSLKDHMTKAHNPMLGKKGVKSWTLPSNYCMVPKSKLYSCGSDNSTFSSYLSNIYNQPVSPPEEPTLHKLELIIPPDTDCLECNRPIISSEHFPQKLSCSSCRFVCDCLNTMQLHKIKCRKASISQMSKFSLDSYLHCICGFTSNCGNQIAKHLALCERKTAYPTAEQAKLAIDNNSHSMLDVLGLVRRNDESREEIALSSEDEESFVNQRPSSVTSETTNPDCLNTESNDQTDKPSENQETIEILDDRETSESPVNSKTEDKSEIHETYMSPIPETNSSDSQDIPEMSENTEINENVEPSEIEELEKNTEKQIEEPTKSLETETVPSENTDVVIVSKNSEIEEITPKELDTEAVVSEKIETESAFAPEKSESTQISEASIEVIEPVLKTDSTIIENSSKALPGNDAKADTPMETDTEIPMEVDSIISTPVLSTINESDILKKGTPETEMNIE